MKCTITISTLVLLLLGTFPGYSAQGSKVEFSLLRIDRSETNKPYGVFSFRQTIKRTLQIHGFGLPKDGLFFPWYVQYQMQTNGEWRTIHGFYSCGMIGSFPLRSRQTYTFKIGLASFTNSAALWRVGISTAEPHTNYWSTPFRLSDSDDARLETTPPGRALQRIAAPSAF